MNLCLLAVGLIVPLGTADLTLAWTHSVEKTAWEEDWQATDAGLVLTQARIRGSGAGMEPPPDALLEGGFWHWRPNLPPMPRVTLRRSGATADWRICVVGTCRDAGRYLPADADPVTLEPCP